MSPWLYTVHMDSEVREENAKVLGKRLELVRANGGRIEMVDSTGG